MAKLGENYALWIPLIIWFVVQSLKVVTDIVTHKRFSVKRLWGSGGMPSSHSALVMSVSTIAALVRGLDSLEFAACLIFSTIVMYDAARCKTCGW